MFRDGHCLDFVDTTPMFFVFLTMHIDFVLLLKVVFCNDVPVFADRRNY